MQKEDSFPKFISNSPCGEDHYESKSQSKTAENISSYIKSEPNDIRLIGLDGEWGSGKSNAISIIDEILGVNYHTFIYDTWAHQEDLQRRSFLEELTENLSKNKIIEQKKWEGELKRLLAKVIESKKRTIPKLSSAIIVSILLFFLLPFLKALSDLTDKVFLKFAIALSPIIIVGLFWLYAYIKSRKKITLQELFYIYKEKDLEEINEETISESEPSVRSFKKWLQDLSAAVPKEKYVLVVFDNMDRLPADKVKIIWSLIHTFFSSQTFPKFWIIVPFDRTHVQEAFRNSDADLDYEKTNHFISKTFPIIFHISPAVLTDWKQFFERKFAEAFGETEKEDYLITRKLFDLYSLSITPRKVIAFINDLVSLRLTSYKEVRLRYIALFILNRQQIISKPLTEILNKGFLAKSQNLFTTDDEVSDNIASLLYNVPLTKASQVTLQRQIELAVRQRKVAELVEISKNPDFLTMLEQISTEDLEVGSASLCLYEIEKTLENPNKETLQMIWDRIIGRQLTLRIDSLEFKREYEVLIEKCRPTNRKYFVSYLLRDFIRVSDFSGAKYYEALKGLETFLTSQKIDINILSLIESKEVTPEQFVEYVDNAEENYKNYKLSCNPDTLDKYFSEKTPDSLDKSSIIWIINDEYNFPELLKTIEKSITDNKINLENLFPVFNTYQSISPTELLKVKLSDASIISLLKTAEEKSPEYYELSAMRIARGASFKGLSSGDHPVLSKIDEDFIDEISNTIEHYEDFGNLMLSVLNWPQPALLHTLKNITQNKTQKNTLKIESIITHFKEISNKINVTEIELLDKLNEWSEDLKAKLSPLNLENIITDPDYYWTAIKYENDLNKTVLNVAISFLQQVSIDDWENAFKNHNSYLFRLMLILIESNRISVLPVNAFSAFKTALKDIANNDEEYEISYDSVNVWHTLYEKSDKTHLQATIKDIRDAFLRDNNINEDQFLIFEPLLREKGNLMEKSGEVVRKIILITLSNQDCLKVLILQSDFYTSLIVSAGNDAFDFIDELRDKIESDPSNIEYRSLGEIINKSLSKDIKIHLAKYYSARKGEDDAIIITDNLKRIVEKENQLHFLINNEIVGHKDPDEGMQKNLYVKYSFKGEDKERIFDEHNWFKLP